MVYELGDDLKQPDRLPFFVKTGLLFEVGASFENLVPDRFLGQLKVAFGSTPADTVIVNGCGSGHRWAGVPGGYYVAEAGCYQVTVRVPPKEVNVLLPLGSECV
jgi:hypothetical protein